MDKKDEIIDTLSEIIKIVDGNTKTAGETVNLLLPHMETLRRLDFDTRRIMNIKKDNKMSKEESQRYTIRYSYAKPHFYDILEEAYIPHSKILKLLNEIK